MTNVPATLRARLAEELPFPDLTVVRELTSDDGLTRKRLLRLHDGKLIESVLMLYDPRSDSRGRATVCVSSQAGCAMGCVFCATGQAGFDRNLTAGEILAQVTGFAREQADAGAPAAHERRVHGHGRADGELPRGLARRRDVCTTPDGIGMAARHITISTVGLIPGIRKLAEEPLQVGLAVSLHAPDEALRERLIPTAHRFPLPEIIDACRDYVAKTRPPRHVRVLPDGPASTTRRSRRARSATLLRGIYCHVNLIPVNPTAGRRDPPPHRARGRSRSSAQLAARGIACTVRVEKGVEISAACGQLRGDHAARPTARSVPHTKAAAPSLT